MQNSGGDTPHAGVLHAKRLKREPGRDCEQRVRDQHRQQIALNLDVDLLEYFHGVFFARQRRTYQLHELAAEVLSRSEQEISKQQNDRGLSGNG